MNLTNMNTNERFDEQFCHTDFISDKQWERYKTFISQEKNILLDQAIKELGKKKWKLIKHAEPESFEEGQRQAYNEAMTRTHNQTIDQAIDKLKELKE